MTDQKRQFENLDSAMAQRIMTVIQKEGWQVMLDEITCRFSIEMDTEHTEDGISITCVDLDNEVIDYFVPMCEDCPVSVSFSGAGERHTIILQWQDPNWINIMSVTRTLTLVNETARLRENLRERKQLTKPRCRHYVRRDTTCSERYITN